MENKVPKNYKDFFKYLLLALIAYIGGLTGYHSFKIIEYFIKPVSNPLMPLGLYKYIAFPYLSFIPFLLGLLFLGIYFYRKEYFKKGHVFFYIILILLFHFFQTDLHEFFDGFNSYG